MTVAKIRKFPCEAASTTHYNGQLKALPVVIFSDEKHYMWVTDEILDFAGGLSN